VDVKEYIHHALFDSIATLRIYCKYKLNVDIIDFHPEISSMLQNVKPKPRIIIAKRRRYLHKGSKIQIKHFRGKRTILFIKQKKIKKQK
jgi:hypothetical protein